MFLNTAHMFDVSIIIESERLKSTRCRSDQICSGIFHPRSVGGRKK